MVPGDLIFKPHHFHFQASTDPDIGFGADPGTDSSACASIVASTDADANVGTVPSTDAGDYSRR